MARQGIGMARQGHMTGKGVLVEDAVGLEPIFLKWAKFTV